MSRTRVVGAGVGVVVGLLVGGGALVSGGCATYANYPPIESDVAVHDPNIAPLPTVMTLGVGWVVSQYPVEGEYVVNWPRKTDHDRALKMATRVGDGARVVSDETMDMPVYHVSRIWLRGDRCEVDVMRPVGRTEGGHQTVTVHLKNELGRWVVSTTKAWPVGLVAAPDLYGWELED